MSITDKEKIDIIGTDDITGNMMLTITDHLDWEDENYHVQMLQDKINSYIEFVESGQMNVEFPKSLLSEKIIIQIVSMYEYPKIGKDFIQKAIPTLESIGVDLIQNISKD